MGSGTYPGGKGLIYRWLINEIPPHKRFISLFLGHCAIMRHKRPATINIGLDLDADVVEQWQQWRPIGKTDATLVAAQGPMAAAIGGNDGPAPSDRAIQARSGKDGAVYRCGSAGATIPPALSVDAPLTADPGSNAAATWLFYSESAFDWLNAYGRDLGPDDFVYADPPYLHDSRSSGRDFYNYELDQRDHVYLVSLLLKLRCNVMLSHYHHPLYMDGLRGWRWECCRTVDRAGNEKTEYIWCNYDQPSRLHDYRWLGADFRQRQNIKRKQARWLANLGKMDRLERLAMMEVMEKEFGSC